MRPLAFVTLLLLARGYAQRLPCDLVAEQELPNCRFTVRSNYGLRGPVHTARVISQKLAPDPRTGYVSSTNSPKLAISEPGVWLVFSRDGDLIENSGSLAPDGTPLKPARERRTTDGNTSVVISGTPDDPEAFRREDRLDEQGNVVEQIAYVHGKITSRHVQRRDPARRSTEDLTYDGAGKLIADSTELQDARGRWLEWVVSDHGRLVLHQRDTYTDNHEQDGDGAGLVSRAWYDDTGALIRIIVVHEGEMTSSWQRPNCGELCNATYGVGLDFSFDHDIDYEFQPDGSVFTTIQHHAGRYGNIEPDDVELFAPGRILLEKVAYRYDRDPYGNWTSRTISVLDPSTGQMTEVRRDHRDLTYY